MYKVFLVDDEPFIIDGLKQIINWGEYGMEICGTAPNGLEALHTLETAPINILITDIRMPKMNGLELIRHLKNLETPTRFIILSGYDDFDYLKESIQLGIENYLLKPVNQEELLSTLVTTIRKIEADTSRTKNFQKDIDVIRENVLYRWVANLIMPAEFLERSALLEIDLENTQFCVCIFRPLLGAGETVSISRYGPKGRILSEIRRICKETIEAEARNNETATSWGKLPAMVFDTPDGDILILFRNQASPPDKSWIHHLLRRCLEQTAERIQIPSFVTAGSIEPDYTTVYQSFYRALKLQEYRLILPFNSILDYDTVKTAPATIHSTEYIDFEKLKKLFAENNKPGIETHIDEVFRNLSSLDGITPTFAQNVAAEILVGIITAVKSLSIGQRNISSLFGYTFSEVFHLQSLDDMSAWIKNISFAFVDYLAEQTENVNPLIKRTLEFIHAYYYQDISLKTLADRFNTNANYLGQLFKNETGEYFSDYLNQFRINKAKEMFVTTGSKSSDVSTKVGYTDQSYFYRMFRKYTGVSPAEYRNFSLENRTG
jgi:two-component system response regulator YesN